MAAKLQVVEPTPFVVEMGHALLPLKRGNRVTGPITAAMRELLKAPIGASVFVPDLKPARLGPYIHNAGGKGCIVTRAVSGGARAWKIAEPKA